jgi:hypothetical protein
MTNKNYNIMAFGKKDYIILAAGLLVVILGYVLMSGGGSADPTEFSEDIFSFRRITLAPLVVLAGYGLIMYAVLRNKD